MLTLTLISFTPFIHILLTTVQANNHKEVPCLTHSKSTTHNSWFSPTIILTSEMLSPNKACANPKNLSTSLRRCSGLLYILSPVSNAVLYAATLTPLVIYSTCYALYPLVKVKNFPPHKPPCHVPSLSHYSVGMEVLKFLGYMQYCTISPTHFRCEEEFLYSFVSDSHKVALVSTYYHQNLCPLGQDEGVGSRSGLCT